MVDAPPRFHVSTHTARVTWQRATPDFAYETYDRSHVVRYGSGIEVPAAAAPEYKGDPTRLDPEEALVGALSSCHMLTFLAVAAKKGFVVDAYTDDASGVLEAGPDRKIWLTRVTLRPSVRFGGERTPTAEELASLHDKAHANCFIANSVKTAVTVEPA